MPWVRPGRDLPTQVAAGSTTQPAGLSATRSFTASEHPGCVRDAVMHLKHGPQYSCSRLPQPAPPRLCTALQGTWPLGVVEPCGVWSPFGAGGVGAPQSASESARQFDTVQKWIADRQRATHDAMSSADPVSGASSPGQTDANQARSRGFESDCLNEAPRIDARDPLHGSLLGGGSRPADLGESDDEVIVASDEHRYPGLCFVPVPGHKL